MAHFLNVRATEPVLFGDNRKFKTAILDHPVVLIRIEFLNHKRLDSRSAASRYVIYFNLLPILVPREFTASVQ